MMQIDLLRIAQDLIKEVHLEADRQVAIAEGMERGVNEYYRRIKQAVSKEQSIKSSGETEAGEQSPSPSLEAAGAAGS